MEVVLIALAALVLAVIAWTLVRKGRDEAEADERAARARREAAAAEHQVARAESARAEAEQHARERADAPTR